MKKKLLKTLSASLGLSLLVMGGLAPSALAQESLIKDPNLAICVNQSLGSSESRSESAPITKEDLQKLAVVNCSGPGSINLVSSLQGLEYATNLGSLFLSVDQNTDFSPLSGLSQLRQLNLFSEDTFHLSSLGKLTQITSLVISGTSLNNISALQSLKSLESLELASDQINDLTALKQFPQLQQLSVISKTLSDISPLSSLTNLSELILFGGQIKDISPLQGLTQLTNLMLADNQIRDFRPLAGHPKVEEYQLYPQKVYVPVEFPEYKNGLQVTFKLNNDLSAPLITPKGESISLVSDAHPFIMDDPRLQVTSADNTTFTITFNDPFTYGDIRDGDTQWQVVTNDYFGVVLQNTAATGNDSNGPVPPSPDGPRPEPGGNTGPDGSRPGPDGSRPGPDGNSGGSTGPGTTPDKEPGTEPGKNPGGTNKPGGDSNNAPDTPNPGQSDTGTSDSSKPGTSTPNTGKPNTGNSNSGKLSFIDVAGYPFVKEIEWLATSGVTTGYPDKTFRPHDSVSRAAMAAFLYRLEGKPDYTAPAKSPFTDIKPGDDFYKEICWLASKGITTGYADKSFKPWDSISREAMAAFLHRYDSKVAAKKLPAKLAAKKFTDTGATPFAKDIAWLSQTGVTTGYADGSFKPYDPIERGAIAAFFYRMKH